MGSFRFWLNWLLGASAGIVAFGVAMALLAGTPLFDAFDRQIDAAFFSAATTDEVQSFQRWVYAVLGGTMAGWGLTLAFLVHHPYRNRERWAWTAIASSLVLWFILDTTLSATSGVWFNVAFNCVPLLAVLVPLLATRSAFSAPR